MTSIELKGLDCSSVTAQQNETMKRHSQEDDNIFAAAARKAGLENFADFLRDDWSANTARKAGFDKFANWIDNKTEDGEDLNDNGFFSNLARNAVKHPIITVTSVISAIFLGKSLAKALKNSSKSKKPIIGTNANTTISATPATVANKATLPQKSLTKSELQKIISEGVEYEEKIGFANLEIFKDVSPQARERILNHFAYHVDKERFLTFATGSTPGLLEYNYLDDIFDVLRSDSIKVIEAFDKKAGTLILNKKSALKIIEANKTLFAQRLGLPEASSVDEIFTLISKFSNGPLSDAKKYMDLKLLLTGSARKNATFSQILQDIANLEKHRYADVGHVSFYNKSAKGIDSFKQALIDNLNSSKSSYSTMPQSFKEEVLKMIDSITLEEYARRLGKPSNFFQDSTFQRQKQEALLQLATKLNAARQTGASINML